MSAKLVLLVGLVVIGGYVGTKVTNYDPTLFPYPKEQVRKMLAEARTSLPRRDGPGEIQIWGNGRTSQGVSLNMRYASWAPLLTCQAVITEVSAEETRVVPDCGKPPVSGSAISSTQNQLRTPMFAEHIMATLNKRPFDRDRVDAQESAVVFSNLGGMQREALKASDETQRMIAESKH